MCAQGSRIEGLKAGSTKSVQINGFAIVHSGLNRGKAGGSKHVVADIRQEQVEAGKQVDNRERKRAGELVIYTNWKG